MSDYYALRLLISVDEKTVDECYGFFLPPERNPHRKDIPLIVALAKDPETLGKRAGLENIHINYPCAIPSGFPDEIEVPTRNISSEGISVKIIEGKATFRYIPLSVHEAAKIESSRAH